MLISDVKPDIGSMVSFFDYRHHFYTKVIIYFTHNEINMRAILLFAENITLERLEVYVNGNWVEKKGNPHLYGLVLTQHQSVHEIAKRIRDNEQQEKAQLEERFRAFICELAEQFPKTMPSLYPTRCVVADDFLSIMVYVENGEDIVTSKIETNLYFPDDSNDVQTLLNSYRAEILKSVMRENDAFYMMTIPYEGDKLQYVSVYLEGYCSHCHDWKKSYLRTMLELNPDTIAAENEKLLVPFVGKFMCPTCEAEVADERVVVKDTMTGRTVREQEIVYCRLLGSKENEREIRNILHVALGHQAYFEGYEDYFWNAYCYAALQNWDEFLHELTNVELQHGLEVFGIYEDDSLLEEVSQQFLSDEEKMDFWRKANEETIAHYLMITVFGWNIPKEIERIGLNRAEFIFRYLPCPPELENLRRELISQLFIKSPEELTMLQETMNAQKRQIHALRQENGRLTNKLGEAYKQVSKAEEKSHCDSQIVRNKADIQKIHHLKGLIEELKNEIERLTIENPQEELIEEVELTEEPIEEGICSDDVLEGKTILILGGYRTHLDNQHRTYQVITHDTRRLDPDFYERLKKADIIVVLTRYISHRAMWEAKEYAILEQKPIYYTSFTNIPRIAHMIAVKEQQM
ncbi:DUF2325 domain-containing protein [Bacillus sp. AGMB 02131]|uniref:DUF2325 domain-containing protein n=1 Tax=Peribacillus faecalis TaxID=2772559 RepID=A0A927CU36_9BACI|nr:DUF2325 domain-containing protein [Peribacillus faecalis]MBD3107476.1 DUF2325 domain-containing protein [Peribacillus faecalis]